MALEAFAVFQNLGASRLFRSYSPYQVDDEFIPLFLDESYVHVNDNWGMTWGHKDDSTFSRIQFCPVFALTFSVYAFESAVSDSKGEMIVIIGAGSKLGEVKGARKVYHVRNSSSADYHGNFNQPQFKKWFEELLASLAIEYQERKFVIVLGACNNVNVFS